MAIDVDGLDEDIVKMRSADGRRWGRLVVRQKNGIQFFSCLPLEKKLKKSDQDLSQYILERIPDYTLSREAFRHDTFGSLCISAYPIEKPVDAFDDRDAAIDEGGPADGVEAGPSGLQEVAVREAKPAKKRRRHPEPQDRPKKRRKNAIDAGNSHMLEGGLYKKGMLPEEMSHEVKQGSRIPGVRYARPILELELMEGVGPCVRCYITLAGRPRPGSTDKDITQDPETKEITLSGMDLMNFGEPLRALTWVEDYIKNPEHYSPGKKREVLEPMIRSFLIPLDNYCELLGQVQGVDMDRAAGQVRFTDAACVSEMFKPVPGSLVTFCDQAVNPCDGMFKNFEDLSGYVIGEALHPRDFSREDTNSHQHNRSLSGGRPSHCAFFSSHKARAALESFYLAGAFRKTRSTEFKGDCPSRYTSRRT